MTNTSRLVRLALPIVLASALLSISATAQTRDPFAAAVAEDVGMSSAKLRDATAIMKTWVDEGRMVGGSLLVIRNGTTALREAVGWSDRERGIPLRTDHIVNMRSMTKPLVGTAVLMLREEGKLQLEDRVSKYLPSFDNAKSREITVYQLLTHTSGIKGSIYVATGRTPYIGSRAHGGCISPASA